MQGRIVYLDKEKFSRKKTINITFDKGIYFLKLTGDVSFATQKLLFETNHSTTIIIGYADSN